MKFINRFLPVLFLIPFKIFSQINMTTTGSHTQNFNTLAATGTGTTNTWTNNSTIANWYSQRTGTGTNYDASTGTATAGNLYSFGSTSNTDRSIGSIGSSNAAAGNFAHGVLLRNTSGNTITSITITYTLEQWRNGGNTTPNTVTFWYQTSTSTITSLTPNNNTSWTQVATLSSSSPINTATAGALDGNATTNKVTLSNISIPSLSLANNSFIMLKWEDPDHTGTDHGLGIDDVTISWTTTTPTATITGATTTATFTTTYGTSSSTQTFSISGSNLTANIVATAPTGFEVSSNGTTWGTTATFTQSSGSASGTLSVRLKSNASAGTYNSQNIVLSSTGATSQNITTPTTGNVVSQKGLTITGLTFSDKVYDGTTSVTQTGTPQYSGLVLGETFSVSGTVTWAFSSANAGLNSITRTGSFTSPSANYSITQPTGFSATINKATQTITFNNLPFKSPLDVDFAPDAISSSGLTLTLTSSDVNVASIVSNKIHIVGVGICQITVSQSGNTNYLPATSITKDLIVKMSISTWTLESITVSNTGTTPNFGTSSQEANLGDSPTGSQLTAFHSSSSTSWTTPVGNGNSKSLSATNWSVGDYFQFKMSTFGYDSILLTFEQTSSNTGPRDFKLQTSFDGTNYTDVGTYSVPFFVPSNTSYAWSSVTYQPQSAISFNLKNTNDYRDQLWVYFRLVMTSTTALLGGVVASGGTSRIDNISVMGDTYDIPLDLEEWIRNNPKPQIKPKNVVESDVEKVYFDLIGRKVSKLEVGKIYLEKSEDKQRRILIVE